MLETIRRLCEAVLLNVSDQTAQAAFNANLEELSVAIDVYLAAEYQGEINPGNSGVA